MQQQSPLPSTVCLTSLETGYPAARQTVHSQSHPCNRKLWPRRPFSKFLSDTHTVWLWMLLQILPRRQNKLTDCMERHPVPCTHAKHPSSIPEESFTFERGQVLRAKRVSLSVFLHFFQLQTHRGKATVASDTKSILFSLSRYVNILYVFVRI